MSSARPAAGIGSFALMKTLRVKELPEVELTIQGRALGSGEVIVWAGYARIKGGAADSGVESRVFDDGLVVADYEVSTNRLYGIEIAGPLGRIPPARYPGEFLKEFGQARTLEADIAIALSAMWRLHSLVFKGAREQLLSLLKNPAITQAEFDKQIVDVLWGGSLGGDPSPYEEAVHASLVPAAAS